MKYYILYLVLTTLLAHSVLVALFDGHIFAELRGFLNRFRDKAIMEKSKIKYIFGYLATCYMCMSYWVSWISAAALFALLKPFMQPLAVDYYYSAGLVIAAGFISAGALNILNLWLPATSTEDDDVFFPWNRGVKVIDVVSTPVNPEEKEDESNEDGGSN